MNILEYIQEYYPIKDRVAAIKADPVQRVMDNDSLPYDDIRVIDGKLQKAVEVADGEYWAVTDLISYTEDDIRKLVPDVLDTYKTYMSLIKLEDFDIQQIVYLSRQYRLNREKEEKLLCTE